MISLKTKHILTTSFVALTASLYGGKAEASHAARFRAEFEKENQSKAIIKTAQQVLHLPANATPLEVVNEIVEQGFAPTVAALGHAQFDDLHNTLTAANAEFTDNTHGNEILTLAGGLENDSETITRAQLKMLYRWMAHNNALTGGNDHAIHGKTEDDVTLKDIIEALHNVQLP